MRFYFCLFILFLFSFSLLSQNTNVDYFKKLTAKEKNVIVNKGTEYQILVNITCIMNLVLIIVKHVIIFFYTSNHKFKSNLVGHLLMMR